MGTQSHSRKDPQANVGGQILPPYPLTSGEIGFWLRRGEQIGRAARWIAARIAAGHARAATWRRHVTSKGASHPPAHPG